MTIFHGFELQREERLSEIASLARLYVHKKTGAELLSLISDDENKVFGASFHTPPADSNGIAHIMEHSVLCGSKKYPVKAPFLEMLKSSLNTFLNAMTYPDKTVYPVASTNLQDFYNLVEVYLDAVFHPRITPEILKQEGWHYELETPDAPLIYKGVVFNEMKGNYSSADTLVYRLSQQSVYPDTIYGVDSGGDPQEIPNLTYETFKAFHERFYHPSNAKLFFYGDDDPDRRLEMVDAVLNDFSRVEPESQIDLQPKFDAPRKIRHTLPSSAAGEGNKQARITINWMLGEAADVEAELALFALNEILVGTSASPLRKALIDSRLGDNLTGTGLHSALLRMRFGAGLKGIDPDEADKVEALILDTLKRLADDGIDPLTVEAALNTIEFRLRENNTGAFPRGIRLLLSALQAWNYDRDPLAPLAWEKPLNALKSRIAGGERVFETLIRSQFIDNPHRATVLFTPDPDQAAREDREEREKLDAIQAAMSAAEIETVIEETRALKALQEAPDSPQALAKIPRLTLGDLPVRNTPIPIEVGEVSGAQVITHDLPANGIIYIDIGLDLRRLPPELLPYTGIFKRALLETGAGGRNMVQLSQWIGRATGGMHTQSWASSVVGGENGAARLFLRAKAMPEKAGDLVKILTEVLLSAKFDNRERIEQIINEERASVESRLVPGGSQFAGLRLRSSLTEADWAAEQICGISYLNALRRLSEGIKANGAGILAELERMRGILLDRSSMVFNITADGGDLRRFEPELTQLIEAMPRSQAGPTNWLTQELPRFEALTMPAKVNYVAKGESLPKLGHKPGGAAIVAGHWLRGGWLWEKVRVQGGAYGAFNTLDLRSGVFTFGSYRDPNLLETIAVYDGAAGFLRRVADSDIDLERAIIGTIGSIDAYRLPDAKGFVSLQRHLGGESEERLQTIRDQVLATDARAIRSFADALDAVASHGRSVVLGSAEAIEKANNQLEDRFTLTKVM